MIATTGAKLAEMFGFTKEERPKDGDGDGLVFDGTEQERPVEKSSLSDVVREHIRKKVWSVDTATIEKHIEMLRATGRIDQADEYQAQLAEKIGPTKTKSFKAWFGDWESDPSNASKVVDADGNPQDQAEIAEPKPVYHGTGKGGWNEFEPRWGQATGLNGGGETLLFGPGFYFTEDPTVAESYSKIGAMDRYSTEATKSELNQVLDASMEAYQKDLQLWIDADMEADATHVKSSMNGIQELKQRLGSIDDHQNNQDLLRAIHNYAQIQNAEDLSFMLPEDLRTTIDKAPTSEVKKVYLKIRNPLDMDAAVDPSIADKLKPILTTETERELRDRLSQGSVYGHELPAIVGSKTKLNEQLQSVGYDGLTHIGGRIMGGGKEHRVWIAFTPTQIKAVDNEGTFDSSNPDIRKSVGSLFGFTKEAAKDGDGDGLVFDGTPEERPVEEDDQNDDVSAVAKRFRIPHQAVLDIVSQSADELKRRDIYFPGSNSTVPTTDFERFPIGSVKIDSFHSDPTNAYVNILTEFDPNDLQMSEAEDGIKKRDKSYPLYVEWAKQGIEPPPISTGETWEGNGTVVSSNRRRVLAAQEAGSRSIKAWHSPINKETGLPLKYGDIKSALNQSSDPQNTKSLSGWNETMIGQTVSVSEKLASFFGFTKAKTQMSLFDDDECGANGPGGQGFQPGNVCGGKSKKGTKATTEKPNPTTSPSPEKPETVDRRTRREQIMDEVYLRMRDLNDEDGDPEEYIADDERSELDALDGHTPVVDSPPEKPSTAEVNRSESLFENPVGTDPNPNAVASAASEQLIEASSDSTDKDYIYARKSDVRNAGEDLAMSRRHIANMWKETIESATDDQRAKLLTKANMMRNEPHLLAESWTPEDGTQKGLVHAAVAISLNKFPGSAYDGKYVASAGEDARRKSQDQYVESWRLIKAKGEELAQTETDPDAAVVKLRTFVADRIQKLRADDSKYNPHANQLVDMYKGMVLGRYKKTGVGSQLQDLRGAGPDKLNDAIAGVLENKTVAAALGVKGSSKGAKPKTDLDNLRNFYNADSSERIGGRAVSVGSNPRDVANHLIEKIGFRGVQHGNYVPDDERVFHMKATAEACADLLDVTGLRERDLTFDGKLGIAFGARGAGRGALAHYEPTTVVVNITRKSGSGALAHEWGHFFDHMVGDLYEAESGQTNPIGKDTAHYLSDKTKRGDKYHQMVDNKYVWNDRPANPVIDAMRSVQKSVVDSGFKTRLGEEITKARKNGLSAPQAEYWRSDREVFARSFESWVQHALRVQGRKNDYLTSLASNGGMWPTRKEIEAMAPAFESLMTAHRQHNLKTDKAQYSDSDRSSLAKSLFSRSLAEFFGFTKESACGANGPGGQGFQPGNNCAAEEGDGGDDFNPDKENLIPEDGPSQHSEMLHNIKTDPTKQDRAELLQFAKDVATFKIRKDSLLRRAIKELTTDPTAEDRGRAFRYAGDVLSLKPAVDFVTGKNRGPNPAGDDLKIITGGVRKVVNATVGNLVRLVGRNIAESRASGAPIPDRVNNHRVPMMVRSFTKAVGTDSQDQLVEQITDEVLRRAGNYTDSDVVQEAILDVMEEVLSGEFPQHEQTVAKAGGISGTTGSTGGFLQGKRQTAVESDWLNHEFDPDDYDPPERDR